MRILLVEDHEDSAKVLRILLEGYGHTVIPAGSVVEALKAAAHQPYDLLISDIRLPDGNGRDLLSILSIDRTPPAIAISAFSTPADVQASLEAGFRCHLKKPLDIRLLLSTIDQMTPSMKDTTARMG